MSSSAADTAENVQLFFSNSILFCYFPQIDVLIIVLPPEILNDGVVVELKIRKRFAEAKSSNVREATWRRNRK